LWLGHLADVYFAGIPEDGAVVQFDTSKYTTGYATHRKKHGAIVHTKDLHVTSVGIGATGPDPLTVSGNALITGGDLILGSDLHLNDNELNRPKLKDYAETVNAVGNVNASTAFDFEDGNVQTVTVAGVDTGSQIVFSLTNPPATGIAGTMTVIFTDGNAHGDVAWHSSIEWPGGVAPTLSASGVDVISFLTFDAGTTYYGFVGGINFS
jgi:hypothetical protein